MAEAWLSSADLSHLAQLGVMASGAGLAAEAQTIFDSLVHLRPQRAYPWIGLAGCQLDQARPDAAAALLAQGRQVLAQVTPSGPEATAELAAEQAELACWHGLALHWAGHNAQSQQALHDSLAGPPDTRTHTVARRMLGLPPLASASDPGERS